MFKEKDFLKRKPDEKKTIDELYEFNNKSKTQKHNSNITKKFLSQTLYKLNSEERNSYLDIMLNDLAFYKYQRSQSLFKNTIDTDISSPENFLYNFLEKYLMEVSYITDKEKREEKIRKIYEWYKEKKKFEKDMKTINYKSYKERNEVDENEYLLTKKESKFKTLDNDNNHRNIGLINKKMLEEYERKKMNKPFWALKKAISSQTLSFQGNNTLMTSTSLSRNNYEKVDLNSIYSSTKGTNVPTKKNYIQETSSFIDKPEGGLMEKDYIKSDKSNTNENIFLPPVNRETKFSYSYFRPMYDLNSIYLENKIIKEKNRLLSLKRNQEEIKEKLKEYSLFRAKFKENLNNKFEMRNLLNLYVNQNNLSSFLLKKYKVEEKEKKETIENIESKSIKSINESKEGEVNEINKNKKGIYKSFKSDKTLNKLSGEDFNYSNSNYFKSESSENYNDSIRGKHNSTDIHTSLTPNVKLFDLSEEKNKDKDSGKLNRSSRFSLTKRFSIKRKRKTLTKKKSIILSNLFPLKLFSGKNEKIKTGQIQNLETDSKTIKSSQIVNIKEYKFKFPQEKVKFDLLNKNMKENNSDALPRILANEVLNKDKFNYQQLCKINNNPVNKTYLESDIRQTTKLNLLNKENVDKINKQLLVKIKKKNFYEKLNRRYNTYKHNFLSMRKSMSIDKRKEFDNLANKIKLKQINDNDFYDESEEGLTENENKSKNSFLNFRSQRKTDKKNFPLLNALINPKENSNYSRFFLPRNGSMLLSRDKGHKFF